MKKIIWNEDGKMVVTTPSQEFFDELQEEYPEWDEMQILRHIADKDVPTGTRYEIVEEPVITSAVGDDGTGRPDRTFRDAWEYDDADATEESSELSDEDKRKYGQTWGNSHP